MSEPASCSSAGLSSVAASAPSTSRSEDIDIKFNGKTYKTWQQASDAFLALQGKAKSGSVWDRVSKFRTGEAGNASFDLRCKKCGSQCQLMNPAKWHKDHTDDACKKRAIKAPGAVAGAQVQLAVAMEWQRPQFLLTSEPQGYLCVL